MRSLLRPGRVPASLLAVILVVTGCQALPQLPTQTAEVAEGQPDASGELITNIGSEPDTIDPQRESFIGEIGVTMRVFEALMTFDLTSHKPIPAAAKDQPTVSADGKTYTYTLRDGLTYSDGSPLTAKDFQYGWERLCDPATAGDYAFTGYIVDGCEAWNIMDPRKDDKAKLDAAHQKLLSSVQVKGDQITFTLREPAPYFNSIAGIWVGLPVKRDAVAKGGERWTEPPTYIGNGPFVLSEWRHNEKFVFVRNDKYRNPPKVKQWTMVMIPEGQTAFAAYRNDELHLYGVAAEDTRSIAGDPEMQKQLVEGQGSCTWYVGFNDRKPPFTDRNVRVAFARSFDRDQYVKDIVGGIGKPATSFIPPGFPGHDPDDTFQKYDVAAAKAALAAASPDMQPLIKSLKISYASNSRTKTRLEWFQQQWKQNLGVDVALDPVDPTTYTQLVKKPETLPLMFMLGWCADYYDQQDWLTTVFSSKASSASVGYRSKDFDDLVFAADKALDPVKRDDLYKRASRLLSQDAAVAWLYFDQQKILVKPYVKDLHITGLGFETAVFTDVYVIKHR